MSVHALALSANHEFSKTTVPQLNLLTGLGVEGDCHSGEYVQHRSRLHLTPRPPNLRQVHLIPKETLDARGLLPGQIGENVTTIGIDLLALGKGAKLHFLPSPPSSGQVGNDDNGGENENEDEMQTPHPIVVIQGLRNPCPQIDKFWPGLRETFLVRDGERKVVGRTAGVMGTVKVGGVVSVGMRVVVEEAEGGYEPLGCV